MLFCISVLLLVLACCKSRETMMYAGSGYLSEQPVIRTVTENIQDTITLDVRPQRTSVTPVRYVSQQAPHYTYSIIVGSFAYYQNALRMRNNLARQGYPQATILQDDEGMYRVSAVSYPSQETAVSELARIRQCPQYHQAWILTQRK